MNFLIAVPAPINLPAVFTAILSDDNKQVQIMLVNPPETTITGVGRKQDQAFCGAANLSGVFQVELSGTYLGPSPLEGSFRRLGKLAADGAGNFSVSSTANYNGMIVPETFTGTYTMGSDCQMELKYSQPGINKGDKDVATTIQGVLTDRGKSAYLIVSEPQMTVISGSLKAQ